MGNNEVTHQVRWNKSTAAELGDRDGKTVGGLSPKYLYTQCTINHDA